MAKYKKAKKYIINLLILIDQAVNCILGGSPDHTLSGRAGYNARKGNSCGIFWEKIINFIFFWQDDHCYKSIEWRIMERDHPEDDIKQLKK